MLDRRFVADSVTLWASRFPAAPPSAQARPRAPRDKYLRDWKLVKQARFNAAKRFERRQNASTVAFALAGVIGFLVPFYTLIFKDDLSQLTKNVLDFAAYVTGALSLSLGLIEQAKDYPAKARQFDQCGRRVNRVLRSLVALDPAHHPDELRPLIEAYETALEECAENHDEIDYEIAKAQEALSEASPNQEAAAAAKLSRLRWQERVSIYGLYVATWVIPPLIALALWIGMRTGS